MRIHLVMSAVLLVLLLVACAPVATPAPQLPAPVKAAPAPETQAATPLTPAKPAWQEKWEQTLAAAGKEGKVVLASTAGGELRAALTRVFKSAYGVSLETIVGRTAELNTKEFAQRRAGLYLTDMRLEGANPQVTELKPAGVLERLDPMLILPDLTEPELIKKVWYQGRIPFVDKDHMVIDMSSQPKPVIAINTTLVKDGEIKSWRDLLNPKWKGKLIMNDPTIPGAGMQGVGAMTALLGEDFVREFARAEPIVMRDQRQMLEWLAHGKVSVVVIPRTEALPEFVKLGAPIKTVTPAEGTYMTSGSAGVCVYTQTPHPNAARLFLNWLLSKDGQDVFAPLSGHHSRRLDASTAHLQPEAMRQEGIKYYDTSTEEAILARRVTDKLAVDIFKPLVK